MLGRDPFSWETSPSYYLGFHFLAFSIRLLLRRATICGAVGALGILIFVEDSKRFVNLLSQLVVVINSIAVSTEDGQIYEEQLTRTSTLGCPSPKACR